MSISLKYSFKEEEGYKSILKCRDKNMFRREVAEQFSRPRSNLTCCGSSSDSTAKCSGEENRMMQEEQRRRRRQSGGGLKGRDLSELDCMLIEVTCIKWNLIGTDTGSLTDRHDADGLNERGRGARERENASKTDVTQRCIFTRHTPRGSYYSASTINHKPTSLGAFQKMFV